MVRGQMPCELPALLCPRLPCHPQPHAAQPTYTYRQVTSSHQPAIHWVLAMGAVSTGTAGRPLLTSAVAGWKHAKCQPVNETVE
jgi:hypothetical protein